NGMAHTGFANTVTHTDNPSQAFCVAIQADGKIVATGETDSGGFNGQKAAVVRHNSNGFRDETFGAEGRAITDLSELGGVAFQADGKIVVAGSDGHLALARLNSDGSLDADFDADGKVITDIGSQSGAAAVMIQAAGNRIVVAGFAVVGGTSEVALARYNFDGSLDASFGTNGTLTSDLG